MAMALPQVEVPSFVVQEFDEWEPLMPTYKKPSPRAEELVPALKRLPHLSLSSRFARSIQWVPPTFRRSTEVAVYYLGSKGSRTEGVERARVLEYKQQEQQVVVRVLRTGDLKVVPTSWVLDLALAGAPAHPWLPGSEPPRSPAAAARAEEALEASGGFDSPEAREVDWLREALLEKYGSTIDAWCAVDAQDRGQANLQAFILACGPGYHHGDVAAIFAEIDSEGTGLMTLRSFRRWMDEHRQAGTSPRGCSAGVNMRGELSRASTMYLQEPEEPHERATRRAKAMTRLFKMAMIRQYDSLALAWDEFDSNVDGVLSFTEFCSAMRKLNLTGNMRLIWDQLLGEPAPSVWDFEDDSRVLRPERLDPRLPADLEAMYHKGWATSWSKTHQAKNRRFVPIAAPIFPGQEGADAPTKASARNERARKSSSAMVAEDGKAFRDSMIKKFGSFALTWQALDFAGKGKLDYGEFVRACRRVDFTGKLKQVFEDLTGGEDFLSPTGLDPGLLLAIERKQRLLASKDEAAIARDAGKNRRRLSTVVDVVAMQALEAPHGAGEWPTEGRRTSATMSEVMLAITGQRKVAGPPEDADAFRRGARRCCGDLVTAWRILDERGRGEVTYREFVYGCRKMDFNGNLKQIFEQLARGNEAMVPSDLGESVEAALNRSPGQSPRKGSAERAAHAAGAPIGRSPRP